ncbi:hypothetical protein D3C84_1266140 [compost metagenome]
MDDYVEFLQTYPKGLFDGLIVIMQTALCYGLNVDEQLSQLNHDIGGIKLEMDKAVQVKYRRFCYLLNLYNMRKA